MKITRINVFNVSLRLKQPLQVAKMLRTNSSNTIVRVETDQGITGYGEATFAHFFAGETQGSVTHVVKKFIEPAITGADPTNIIALQEMPHRKGSCKRPTPIPYVPQNHCFQVEESPILSLSTA